MSDDTIKRSLFKSHSTLLASQGIMRSPDVEPRVCGVGNKFLNKKSRRRFLCAACPDETFSGCYDFGRITVSIT